MDCDLCGKPGAIVEVALEGALMRACHKCASLGRPMRNVVSKPMVSKAKSLGSRSVSVVGVESSPEVVEEYGDIVKKGRERLGLSQAQLAHKIAERESIIHKVETSHMVPPIALARKLERALHVHLVDEVVDKAGGGTVTESKQALTIGDIIKFKK